MGPAAVSSLSRFGTHNWIIFTDLPRFFREDKSRERTFFEVSGRCVLRVCVRGGTVDAIVVWLEMVCLAINETNYD